MHFRISKIIITALSVIFLYATIVSAADKVLSIVSGTGTNTLTVTQGDPITLEVRVDDASVIAGASFTITYDTANLLLSDVSSTFFDTFVNQSIPTPNDQGYVTVDTDNYSSPLVDNPVATGSMLAAARVNNGTGTDATLFILSFELIGNTGTYPVSIVQSVISNVAAGYPEAGEGIPFLVGIDGTSYPTHNVTTINGCTLTVTPPFVDTDGDGIDDNWETTYFGNLTTADASSDFDNDGYTDYQEYLNRNETDPSDGSYDPKVQNAPGGTGYVPTKRNVPMQAIFHLLLGGN